MSWPEDVPFIAGSKPVAPAEGDTTHKWVSVPNRDFQCCVKCGVLRRADRQNSPCKAAKGARMNPVCPICRAFMTRLYFHDGHPDDLFECPNRCKIGPDQHVRVRVDSDEAQPGRKERA